MNRGKFTPLIQKMRGRNKIPFLKRKQNGKPALPADVQRQNKLRGRFNSMIRQISLQPTREIGTGVDYLYTYFIGKNRKTVKLDLKFSFGALGDNIIKIRVRERKLINESDWIIALDRNAQAHCFPTSALNKYVNSCWGSISQKNRIDKGSYTELPVNLTDLFLKIGITPTIAKLEHYSLIQALKKMEEQNKKFPLQKEKPKRNIFLKRNTDLMAQRQGKTPPIKRETNQRHLRIRMNNRGRR